MDLDGRLHCSSSVVYHCSDSGVIREKTDWILVVFFWLCLRKPPQGGFFMLGILGVEARALPD